MIQSNVRDAGAGAKSFQPPKDSAWLALVEDTNLPVLVVDAAGQIEFASPAAAKLMSGEPGSIAGRHLREFFTEDLVSERLGVIRDAISTGRPMTIQGMVKGRLRRTVFRPLITPGQPPRVLVVSRSTSASTAQAEEGVILSRANESGQLANLTARELEILKLIGVGLSTADIAKKLGRSVKTVEWHRVSLGDKLGVTNRVELARIAIQAGLVSIESPNVAGAASQN